MIVLGLILLVWRLARADEFLPELPEVAPLLGRAAGQVGRFLGVLGQFLANRRLQNDIAALQDQANALQAGWEATTTVTAQVFDKVSQAWVKAAQDSRAGAIHTYMMGKREHDQWERLRTIIMPNTISYIWTFVWRSWVRPLRQGLVRAIIWAGAWDSYLQVFVINVQAFAAGIQAYGRVWRARYVYPQIWFLLHPWWVAWNYTPAFLTGFAHYLRHHKYTRERDELSRIVYDQASRLWQVVDRALAQWLQTDVQGNGWGDTPPRFPSASRVTPPKGQASNWEPFIKPHREPHQPPFTPNIPSVDYVT